MEPRNEDVRHNAAGHDSSHRHGESCGHKRVHHEGHSDYVVEGHIHHAHEGHCDDRGIVTGEETK